jgi:hypothetical protein
MVALARDGLTRKRARQVASSFPMLARDLGPDYRDTFTAFAGANPPRDGGAVADGLALAQSLAREGRLSADAKVERMVHAAGFVTRRGRLTRRRRPHLAVTATRRPVRLVVVAHIPRVGTRVISMEPLRRSRSRCG